MTTLIRWNPERELLNMRNEMDRLMESFFNTTRSGRELPAESWGLTLDAGENEENYVISAVVPGVSPEDLDVTIEEGVLTIKGEVHQERQESDSDDENGNDGWRYHIRERRYGSFQRSLRLPADVNVEEIEAKHENGVLNLVLPKVDAAKTRRVKRITIQ